jgi:hypothetical protein
MNTVNKVLPPIVRSAFVAPVGAGVRFPASHPTHNQKASPELCARPVPKGMIHYRGLIMKRTTLAALGGALALAAASLCAAPAFAGSDANSNSGAVSGSDSNSNSNSSLNNANTNTNLNANKSNSISNSGSASKSASSSNQHQGQAQGQSQGQGQKQAASAANSGSTTGTNSVTFNSTTPSDQTIRNVPNVYAPALAAAGSEVCLGSVSAGGAAAGFGLTVGGTIVDQECQLRMNARTLATLGYNVAAREEMCIDPQVRAAMLAAGTPCAADRAAPAQARADYEAAVSTVSPPANVTVISAAPVVPASSSARGCRKNYQLLGGWYDVCPTAGAAVYASAENLPTEDAARATPDATASAPGCQRKYQLFGGWYDECK